MTSENSGVWKQAYFCRAISTMSIHYLKANNLLAGLNASSGLVSCTQRELPNDIHRGRRLITIVDSDRIYSIVVDDYYFPSFGKGRRCYIDGSWCRRLVGTHVVGVRRNDNEKQRLLVCSNPGRTRERDVEGIACAYSKQGSLEVSLGANATRRAPVLH